MKPTLFISFFFFLSQGIYALAPAPKPLEVEQGSFTYSEGKNYHTPGKLSVDPRTGAVNYSYRLGGVMADLKRGPKLSLSLFYNSLDNSDRFQLGRGFRYNLTYYVVDTQHLVLSNGSTHKVLLDEQGNPEIQYQKLKNIKIQKATDSSLLFTILYKNGNKESIDKSGKLVSICNLSKDCLSFEYDNESFALTKVYSQKYQSRWIELTVQQGDIVVSAKRADGKPYQTRLVRSQGFLSQIVPGVKNSDSIFFQYGTNKVVREIKMPGGGVHTFSYVNLLVPTGGPLATVPAVNQYRSLTKESGIELKYCYGGMGGSHCNQGDDKNYLGYLSGLTYVPEKDNLFLRDITYRYQTEVHYPNRIQKRTFDKYHRLVGSTLVTLSNQKLRSQKISYPSSDEQRFSDLKDNYQLPVKKEKTLFSLKSGKSRTLSTSSSYDSYGNPLTKTDVMGRLTQYSYCQINQKDQDCPGSKHPFVYILRSKRSYDQQKQNYHEVQQSYLNMNESLVTIRPRPIVSLSSSLTSVNIKPLPLERSGYVTTDQSNNYKEFNSLLPELIVKTESRSLFNGTLLQKETRSYFSSLSDKRYGYLKSRTVTSGTKTTTYTQSYQESSEDLLQIKKSLSPSEYYTYKVTLIHTPKVVLAKEAVSGALKEENYDALGRVIYEKMVSGTTEQERTHTYVQQGQNNYVESIFPTGYKIKIIYDVLGRKKEEYKYTGKSYVKVAEYNYDSNGYLSQKNVYNLDPSGKSYTLSQSYEYDHLGRVTKVINPLQVETHKEYDDALNQVTTYKKSSTGKTLSKVTVTKNNEGKKTSIVSYNQSGQAYSNSSFTYDGFGRKKTSTVNGRSTVYSYDELRFERSATNDLNITTKISLHPVFNKPVSVAISNQALGSLEYDSFGRVIRSIDPDQNTKSVTYKEGLVDTKTDALGDEVSFDYTKGLLQSKSFTSLDKTKTETDSYSYNSYNELSKVDSLNSDSNYTYQLDGKLRSVVTHYKKDSSNLKSSYQLNYIYDQLGKLYQLTDSKGNKITTIRNSKGQIISKTKGNTVYLGYVYDEFGRVKKLTRYGGISTIYSYDEFSRPVSISHLNGTKKLECYIITYNNNNLVTKVITEKSVYPSSVKRTDIYVYDNINRLTKASCSGFCNGDQGTSVSYAYSYDSYNNITSATTKTTKDKNTIRVTDSYSYSSTNPVKLLSLTSTAPNQRTITYSYNKNNQLITEDHSTSSSSSVSYEYNLKGQLTKVTKGKNESFYLYDAKGRIIYSSFNDDTPKLTYYSGNYPLLEVTGNKSLINFGKGQILSINQKGLVYHRLYSPAQNVSSYYSPVTKSWSVYNYSPFGRQWLEKGSSSDRGFQGNLVDKTSGQLSYGNGQRFYDPVSRRFSSYDSKSPFGKGGSNGYAYAANSPVNYSDPTGHSVFGILFQVLMMVGGELLDPAGGGEAGEAAANAIEGAVGGEKVATSIHDLPNEMIDKIAKRTDSKGFKNLRLTSRRMRAATEVEAKRRVLRNIDERKLDRFSTFPLLEHFEPPLVTREDLVQEMSLRESIASSGVEKLGFNVIPNANMTDLLKVEVSNLPPKGSTLANIIKVNSESMSYDSDQAIMWFGPQSNQQTWLNLYRRSAYTIIHLDDLSGNMTYKAFFNRLSNVFIEQGVHLDFDPIPLIVM
ncbi:MAG: RHS repeat-associated core domain-containing protein [Sedimenticola sp.]